MPGATTLPPEARKPNRAAFIRNGWQLVGFVRPSSLSQPYGLRDCLMAPRKRGAIRRAAQSARFKGARHAPNGHLVLASCLAACDPKRTDASPLSGSFRAAVPDIWAPVWVRTRRVCRLRRDILVASVKQGAKVIVGRGGRHARLGEKHHE
jgi:hypothetical protein